MSEKPTSVPPGSLSPWKFPPTTTQIPDSEYVNLDIINLSAFHGFDENLSLSEEEKAAQEDLVSRTIQAFRTVGFLAVTGHGLSTEDLHHHFDLGKMLVDDVPAEEKHELHADITQGSWAGYKPQGYYNRPDGSADVQEHYDFYPFTAVESRLPCAAKPYLGDFRKFIEHNHYVVVRKILAILSLGLNLPVDTLWNLHHRGGSDNDGALQGDPNEVRWNHSKDHLRYGMYNPPTEQDRERKKNLWLPGHTDLRQNKDSQPVAGLQTLMPDGQWKYVRHYPNHIIVQLGDSMEFVTGGLLKALPHRVKEPPVDQRHLRRQGIFYFVPFLPEVPLVPLDHPSLHDLGARNLFEKYVGLGEKPLTSNEWLVFRSKLVGSKRTSLEKGTRESILVDIHFRYNP